MEDFIGIFGLLHFMRVMFLITTKKVLVDSSSKEIE